MLSSMSFLINALYIYQYIAGTARCIFENGRVGGDAVPATSPSPPSLSLFTSTSTVVNFPTHAPCSGVTYLVWGGEEVNLSP